ncbi:MAG: hypothetical protein WEB60_14110, partial [Terrimicrobiaceae bacterium]
MLFVLNPLPRLVAAWLFFVLTASVLHGQTLPATQARLDENSTLIFSYERPHPMPPGLTYQVEAGSDLMGWSSDNLEVVGSEVNGVLESVAVRDPVAVNALNPRRFMRLRVLPDAVASLVIRPDGWTADLVFSGLVPGGVYALAPDSETPALTLSVISPGFDAGARPTTVQRQVIATVPLRQPFPNQLARTEAAVDGGVKITVVLSERIYHADRNLFERIGSISGTSFTIGR